MRPLRVFLCHASQDKPYVLRLHRYLKQHGVEPWLDREELLPGQNWAVEISKALDTSDVILVCLSKASINKEGFVQKEISFALDKALEKPEGMIFIVPVKLEECELPRSLNRYHWVDIFRDGGRKRLLMGLNRRAIELGEDVTPVLIEDTKQRTPKPFNPEIKHEESVDLIPSKADFKEELKQEAPPPFSLRKDEITQDTFVPELKKKAEQEEPVIKPAPFAEKKPFTKLLDPSTLAPKAKPDVQDMKKRGPNNNFRWLGTGGIIFIGLLIVIFGGNYILNNLPASETPALTPSVTLKPPTVTATKTSTPSPPTHTPVPTLGIGSTMIGEKGETLVYVPAGEFTMGDDSGDAPVHTVYLDAFWIDQTEVTNKQYQACVDAGTCEPPSDTSSLTHPSYYGNPEFDNFPVLYVTWDKANRYCEVWAGGDLPTEAQWEKAARGTDARTYPWGNDAPDGNLLNYNSNVGDTTEVGTYPGGASNYGAYDMAGNVWEWVNDWYGIAYYEDSASSNNPVGPESGKTRVVRGGSWNFDDVSARSVVRNSYEPINVFYVVGFRCARSP